MNILLESKVGVYDVSITSKENKIDGRFYDTINFNINNQAVYTTNIMRENGAEDFDITLGSFVSHTLGCAYNGATEELKDLLAFIQEICYNEVELEGDIEILCSVLFHVAENSEEKGECLIL